MEITPYECNENCATPFATTPPNRNSRPNRNRICTKRAHVSQQRPGKRRETSKFRDIETSIQSNMRNKHDKFHNVYTKLV